MMTTRTREEEKEKASVHLSFRLRVFPLTSLLSPRFFFSCSRNIQLLATLLLYRWISLSLSRHSRLHLFSLYLCVRVCVCARMRAEIHYCRRCSTTRSCDRVTSVDRRRRRRCCCCCYRLSSNCPVNHRSFMPNLFQHNRTAVAFVCPVSSCCLVPSFLPVRTESMIGSIHALHGGSDGAHRRAQKERRK